MKVMKLTKAMKEVIIEKAVNQTMKPLVDAYDKRRAEFAQMLYNHMYSEVEQQKMQALPDGWLLTKKDLRISLSDGACTVYATLPDYMRVLAVDREYRDFDASSWSLGLKRKVRNTDAAMTIEYQANRDKAQELRRALEQLVMPCTTLKKLREVWPEGEAFFPSEPEFIENLPAVQSTKVNDLIAAIKGESNAD